MATEIQKVPRYRYVRRDDGDGFQIERRADVKEAGVWIDYFWDDTGDSCDTEEEAKAYIANALAAPA